MNIKSPYSIPRRSTRNPLEEAVLGLHEIGKIKKDLLDLKNKHEAEHKAKMDEIDAKIHEAHSHIKSIAKGEKGDSFYGSQGPRGDKGDSIIGPPGKDAVVDEVKIITSVLSKIPKPKDGSPGKNADVKEVMPLFVKALEEGAIKLKTKHIDGWQDPQEVVRRFWANGGIRGGGDTVAAGTGVTITNSNGVKTINASAGLTELSATETPNGSTTVFTFLAAAAQPSYIVSDNVWMKATTKAGTVNWTWNAGTKKTTLTIPPIDDIYAIV